MHFKRKCSKMDPQKIQIQTKSKAFLGSLFLDGPWKPQKPQNQEKMTKNEIPKTSKSRINKQKRHANCGLAGQAHGHNHCNDGFVLVCKSAVKSTCCTCKPWSRPAAPGVWGCGDDPPQASSIIKVPTRQYTVGFVQNFSANNFGFHPQNGYSRFFDTYSEKRFSGEHWP